jgi:hypothetical protein
VARLRFETARDVFEAFPAAEFELSIEPTDDPSLDFLASLTSGGEFDKAVGFCAFLLPRREAVWWGCRTVRKFVPKRTLDEEEGIRVAEDWVNDPDEERRRIALELGTRYSSKLATTHLAQAAGCAGYSFNIGAGDPIPLRPEQTARCVRSAILIAASRLSFEERPDLMRACLEDGARIAAGEDEGA